MEERGLAPIRSVGIGGERVAEAGRDPKAGVSKASDHPTIQQGGGRPPTPARTISMFPGAVGEVTLPSLPSSRATEETAPHTGSRSRSVHLSLLSNTTKAVTECALISHRSFLFALSVALLSARFPDAARRAARDHRPTRPVTPRPRSEVRERTSSCAKSVSLPAANCGSEG